MRSWQRFTPREGLSAEGVRGIAKRLGRETPNNNTVNLRHFDKNETGLEGALTSLGVRVRYNLRANTVEWWRGAVGVAGIHG